ncbi:hypothetical protein DOTSEDRAFT_72199 [Dothistroma septosporum NZE10]|uniref:Uncharacterized protein n=1 Tax=Dothistroma septosporum (strain NZE10 / CBS 128990) TaxID=675120 RepID=N1PP09_DOTSN|nr:hypothetical protein DOTSEDRAFT_72199 [Dothistroma septosporum NZE10]
MHYYALSSCYPNISTSLSPNAAIAIGLSPLTTSLSTVIVPIFYPESSTITALASLSSIELFREGQTILLPHPFDVFIFSLAFVEVTDEC